MDTKFFTDLKYPDASANETFKANVKYARDLGANWTEAVKFATGAASRGAKGKTGSNASLESLLAATTGADDDNVQRYGGFHMAMPEMAPAYQMGGNNKRTKLKKFIK
jgi:hypothetical protein